MPLARAIALTFALSTTLGAVTVAAHQPTTEIERKQEEFASPSTGAICVFAILAVASEAGRRCPSVENSSFHAELETEIVRLGDHIARTNNGTPADVARLRREQGNQDSTDVHVCSEFPLGIWQDLQDRGPETLQGMVDELLARPGPAIWGTCL